MASVPFGIGGGVSQMTGQQATGNPDYHQALMRAFEGMQKAQEAAVRPKSLSEALLQAQLKNKHDEVINKYLHRSENARIGNTEAQTGLYGQQFKKALMDNQQNQQFNDAFDNHGQASVNDNSGVRGVSAEGPGVAVSASARDTFPDRFGGSQQSENETIESQGDNSIVLNPGNQNMGYIDQMYDANPIYRKGLEARGYKKKTSVHPNQSTGETSVITEWPSGKITSVTIPTSSAGSMSMTPATKTAQQSIIVNAPKVNRLIDKIIEKPSPTEIFGWRGPAKKEHNALVTEAAETLVKARSWPNTKGSIDKAESILQRGTFETDSYYHERLKQLKKEMDKNISEANHLLKPGSKKNTETSNIIEYVRDANGRLVPSNQ